MPNSCTRSRVAIDTVLATETRMTPRVISRIRRDMFVVSRRSVTAADMNARWSFVVVPKGNCSGTSLSICAMTEAAFSGSSIFTKTWCAVPSMPSTSWR